MALAKIKSLENGVSVQYHRITSISGIANVSTPQRVCINFDHYLDAAARSSGKKPVSSSSVYTECLTSDFSSENLIKSAYNIAKGISGGPFEGASDV